MHLTKEGPTQEIAPPDQTSVEASSQSQRWLAIAQQVKDSITIVLMLSTGMLIFGVLFGIAIPGLALYCLRWKLVPEGARQVSSGWLWLLTLVHELICAVGFYSLGPPEDDFIVGHLDIGYGLGALVSLFALRSSGWLTPGKPQWRA
ncbi:hypothetical protein [Hymenobacter negativus]|nr:hypothetical protein [Hymenobacter negativus]